MKRQFKEIRKIPHFYIIRSVEARLLADYIDRAGGPFLDLGCGDGRFGESLGLRGVYGIDIDGNAAAKVKESACYKKVSIANAAEIPFADNFFATVFSNCALEHMDGLERILGEVRRVLKERGEFIFTVPASRMVEVLEEDGILSEVRLNGRDAIDEYNRFHHHVNIFDLAGWQSTLSKAGFKVVKHDYYLPDAIGSFVMRMDMLYTVEAPGSKALLRRLERNYRSVSGISARFHFNRYLKNPHGARMGTHLIIKAEKA